jgi:hypothetical protein
MAPKFDKVSQNFFLSEHEWKQNSKLIRFFADSFHFHELCKCFQQSRSQLFLLPGK